MTSDPLDADALRGELRAQMTRRGVTQSDLAQVFDVSPRWVGRRLSGEVGLSVDELAVMAHALGLQLHVTLSALPAP